MKQNVSLSVALVFAAVILWCARGSVLSHYRREKTTYEAGLAQALSNMGFAESPWAHSFLPDFADIARYRRANLSMPPAQQNRVIFYGDSITDFWPTSYPAQFFSEKSYIGRGITGQSTDAMIWRFDQDVVALHPQTVVILAGTNDVVVPERTFNDQQTIKNIETMAEIAKRHQIRVILCSILPVSHYPQRQQNLFNSRIQQINASLRAYAMQQRLTYVDYYSSMADRTGAMQNSLSGDGIHPNANGYAIMHSLVQAAIDSASPNAIGLNSLPKVESAQCGPRHTACSATA